MPTKKIDKLTIKRSEWLNGNVMAEEDQDLELTEDHNKGTGTSCLIREDGKKCCLGFYALHVGIPKAAISVDSDGTPSSIDDGPQREKLHKLLQKDLTFDNTLCRSLIKANDAMKGTYKTRAAKEKRIKQLFKKIDVQVSFV